jgi:MerR family transcriptional regulator, heat shock protein HspR
MRDSNEGLYSISVIAKLTGLHEQTIRQYERLGLLLPSRTKGGTRTFSEADLERLRAIASLTREMGVNLAGVEIILKMRDRQAQMAALIREVFNLLDDETRRRFEAFFHGNEPGLVPVPKGGLVRSETPAGPKPKPGPRRIEIKGDD